MRQAGQLETCPKGKLKNDEFFGESEVVYLRRSFLSRLAIATRSTPEAMELELEFGLPGLCRRWPVLHAANYCGADCQPARSNDRPIGTSITRARNTGCTLQRTGRLAQLII